MRQNNRKRQINKLNQTQTINVSEHKLAADRDWLVNILKNIKNKTKSLTLVQRLRTLRHKDSNGSLLQLLGKFERVFSFRTELSHGSWFV